MAVAAAAVCYVSWQSRHLIIGPEVRVDSGLATVQNERVMVIEGQAKNVTELYLNGRPIAIDQAGAFVEGVVLENGYTVVSIDARDRFGRRVHWERPFVYVETANVVQR